MTRSQAEAECERRRLLIESKCMLQVSAVFAKLGKTMPEQVRQAIRLCSRESCRVGDLCAFERANAGAGPFNDPCSTPEVEYK